MEQGIYVDILIVTNYIINMLLIMCVGKLSGRSPKRRRIVAAALFGAATSLTIFLPFMGFFLSVLMKLTIAAAIVLITFPFVNLNTFLKQLFLFFAVSFAFGGAMLGIWLAFTPKGMNYYNGVVYFDVSPVALIATTAAAYVIISLAGRFAKGKRPVKSVCKTTVTIGGRDITINGLVDTGNSLREPFSGAPVAVCHVRELLPLLPPELVDAVEKGAVTELNQLSGGLKIRLIPYSNIGNQGILPAVKADLMQIETENEKLRIELVYIGLSNLKVGDESYSCILHPELIGQRAKEPIFTR